MRLLGAHNIAGIYGVFIFFKRGPFAAIRVVLDASPEAKKRHHVDRRDDLGAPERFDVYYGMADYRIGVARLDVPATLPQGAAHYRSQ